MPQLDKVTLFSQVFWLLFLYFFFFLVYLKYFLPTFSKLFKIRASYLLSWNSEAATSPSKGAVDISYLSKLLVNFSKHLKNNITLLDSYYFSELSSFNGSMLKEVNKLFVLTYIKNCLKFNLYKKLYF